MPITTFESLPDSSRVWVYGADRPLDQAATETMLAETDRFLGHWQAHGHDLHSARAELDLILSIPDEAEWAARAIAHGDAVAHAFANFYVITTRPDESVVRGVNLMKGRPANQVGSVTTTR